MKAKFVEQLERIKNTTIMDVETISNTCRVSKALIRKFKPEYLEDINALNPSPNEINVPAIRHTRNNLKGILEAIVMEYEVEDDERLKEHEKSPKAKQEKNESFWTMIHPEVIKNSKKKFLDGHYKDAVFAAVLEL